jgi:hypothetical protein
VFYGIGAGFHHLADSRHAACVRGHSLVCAMRRLDDYPSFGQGEGRRQGIRTNSHVAAGGNDFDCVDALLEQVARQLPHAGFAAGHAAEEVQMTTLNGNRTTGGEHARTWDEATRDRVAHVQCRAVTAAEVAHRRHTGLERAASVAAGAQHKLDVGLGLQIAERVWAGAERQVDVCVDQSGQQGTAREVVQPYVGVQNAKVIENAHAGDATALDSDNSARQRRS